jgi:hypothetical protein
MDIPSLPHKKARTRVLIAAMASVVSTAAGAVCAPIMCSGIVQTMTVSETHVYIRLAGDTVGLTNCTPYSGNYFTLPKSNVNYASYYATLLAAYMAKEQVSLRSIDGSTGCTISYIAVP